MASPPILDSCSAQGGRREGEMCESSTAHRGIVDVKSSLTFIRFFVKSNRSICQVKSLLEKCISKEQDLLGKPYIQALITTTP